MNIQELENKLHEVFFPFQTLKVLITAESGEVIYNGPAHIFKVGDNEQRPHEIILSLQILESEINVTSGEIPAE